MSSQARPFVVRYRTAIFGSELSTSQKIIALAYAEFADEDGHNARPSVTTIARKATLNRATVLRHLPELEGLSWLVPTDRLNGRPTVYRLSIPAAQPVAPCDGSDDATEPAKTGRPVAPRDRTSRTVRPNLVVEKKDPPQKPIQALTIEAYTKHHRGKLSDANRSALAKHAKALEAEGVPAGSIIATAARLAREGEFGGHLLRCARELAQAGGPCSWNEERRGLTATQLRECGCAGCVARAEAFEATAAAA